MVRSNNYLIQDFDSCCCHLRKTFTWIQREFVHIVHGLSAKHKRKQKQSMHSTHTRTTTNNENEKEKWTKSREVEKEK